MLLSLKRKYAKFGAASIEDRDQLVKYFQRLGRETLYDICEYLHLVPPRQIDQDKGTVQEEYSQVGV